MRALWKQYNISYNERSGEHHTIADSKKAT